MRSTIIIIWKLCQRTAETMTEYRNPIFSRDDAFDIFPSDAPLKSRNTGRALQLTKLKDQQDNITEITAII